MSHKLITGWLKICTVAEKKVNSMPEHIVFHRIGRVTLQYATNLSWEHWQSKSFK